MSTTGCSDVAAVVCLGAGPNQVPLIRAARRRGLFVMAVDRNGTAPGLCLANRAIVRSTHDADDLLELIRNLPDVHVRGVLARVTGVALRTATKLTRAFGTPGFEEGLIRAATEKSQTRRICGALGLPSPRSQRLGPGDVPAEFWSGQRTVVKPDYPSAGKVGIAVVSSQDALEGAVELARRRSESDCALVEEFVDGFDVTLCCHLRRGRIEVLMLWDELNGVDEVGGVAAVGVAVPSVIRGTGAERGIEAQARRLAAEFPDSSGILLLSFRVPVKGPPFLVELHADLGGDKIADALLPCAYSGFDFFELAVDAALDAEPAVVARPVLPSVLLFRQREVALEERPVLVGEGWEIHQRGTILANLELVRTAMEAREARLCVEPTHREWVLSGQANGGLV